MKNLLFEIRQCNICAKNLKHGPRPIVSVQADAKIVIIGQAPRAKVHVSGIPWDDASRKQLQKWLGVTDKMFFDETKMSLMPMGFCFTGKGKSGGLPARPKCAPQWYQKILDKLLKVKLTILIGQYAQNYYLKVNAKNTLTETVANYKVYLVNNLLLPDPSPFNRFWLTKSPWFEKEILPKLKEKVSYILVTFPT